MSDKAENASNPLDSVKWVLVFVLLGGLIYGYTAYADISVLYRALAAVAIAVVALGIASTTMKG